MTQTPYAFDSANYALAVRDFYNVVFHQPHPPGYPLYVAFAKVIDLVVRDANRSLVLEGILWSALAVGMTTLLARAMFGRGVGLLAGTLLLLTVGFWGYGEVAYPYVALAGETATLALARLSCPERAPSARRVVRSGLGHLRWRALGCRRLLHAAVAVGVVGRRGLAPAPGVRGRGGSRGDRLGRADDRAFGRLGQLPSGADGLHAGVVATVGICDRRTLRRVGTRRPRTTSTSWSTTCARCSGWGCC